MFLFKLNKTEIWKPVLDYEEYYLVSNKGNVLSLHRFKRRPVKVCLDSKGYCYVHLHKNGKSKPFRVHLMVLEAFVRPRKNIKEQGRHLDGSRTNCNLENLSFGTSKINHSDKNMHGRNNLGSKNGGGGKLTIQDVVDIRNLLFKGQGPKQIAKNYPVGSTMITRIKHYNTWNPSKWVRDLIAIEKAVKNNIHTDIKQFKRLLDELALFLNCKHYPLYEEHLKVYSRLKDLYNG